MDARTSDSGKSGCGSAIGSIFPILLAIGILLIVFSIIGTTVSGGSPFPQFVLPILNPKPAATAPALTTITPTEPATMETLMPTDTPVEPTDTLVVTTEIPDTIETPAATETLEVTETAPATTETAIITPTEETPELPETGGTPDLPLPETGGELAIASTPLPIVYAKASWPPEMAFDASDVIDLLLITAIEGQAISPGVVTVTAAPQDKPASIPLKPTLSRRKIETLEAKDLAQLCNIPPGYQGYAIASLYGSAFDISPQGPQREALSTLTSHQSTIASWAWTITPKRSGSQRVILSWETEWEPPDGISAQPVLCDPWEELVLGITVKNPPLFERGRISLAGVGLIVFGGIGTIFRGRLENWLNSR